MAARSSKVGPLFSKRRLFTPKYCLSVPPSSRFLHRLSFLPRDSKYCLSSLLSCMVHGYWTHHADSLNASSNKRLGEGSDPSLLRLNSVERWSEANARSS